MATEKPAPGAVEVRAASSSVTVSFGAFKCRRGYDLYTTSYTPAVRRTSACLVFHHGLSDHSHRHAAVLSHLASSVGMSVYTYDAHGHGHSGPHHEGPTGRALVRSFHHIVDDLVDFTREFVVPAEQKLDLQQAGQQKKGEKVGEKVANGSSSSSSGAAAAGKAGAEAGAAAAAASVSGRTDGHAAIGNGHATSSEGQQGNTPSKPRVFLLGYSMGGLACCLAVATTCRSASSGSDLYAGLMLTSCFSDALHGTPTLLRPVKLAYVSLLSRLVPAMPYFKRNPVEAGIRDVDAVAEMAADTLWYRGKFKVATIASLLWGGQRLRYAAHRMTLPIYAQHATRDVACSLASLQATLGRTRSTDRTVVVVEDAYHDLHHDPETPVLLEKMVGWLSARVEK